MGLKDEVVVANDPIEESDQTLESVDKVDQDDKESAQDTIITAVESAETAPEPTPEEDESDVVEETEQPAQDEEEEEEEDLEDPLDALREKCNQDPHCSKYKEELDTCTERVEGKEKTTETCAQELYDFIHCVDHLVSKSLFTSLK